VKRFFQYRPGTILSFLGLCLCVWTLDASSQDSDNHTVTVQVAEISVIDVTTNTLNLNILDGDIQIGRDLMTVMDQTSSILWGTNSSSRKVTADTDLAVPQFELRLVALSPTRGTPAPEFALTTIPQDLLLDIGRSLGTSLLRYTGVAYASQGTGTDVHTITFTIVAQ
jgi:hypothetical protein